jgi:hypothetical protein
METVYSDFSAAGVQCPNVCYKFWEGSEILLWFLFVGVTLILYSPL